MHRNIEPSRRKTNKHRTKQKETARTLMETFLMMLFGNRIAHAGMNSIFHLPATTLCLNMDRVSIEL